MTLFPTDHPSEIFFRKTVQKRKTGGDYSVRWLEHIEEVDESAWDSLALPLKTPFLEWEWLRQMESSGSISPQKGWRPRHLTVWKKNRLTAAAALYIKEHSEGEFVFDRPWQDASLRFGIPYYPKMVGMSPVTPLSGYRFLMAPDEDEREMNAFMAQSIDHYCIRNRLSGCSFLFADPEWKKYMTGLAYTVWLHPGMKWENPGFRDFNDYLGMFRSGQRRNIRRELQGLKQNGIRVQCYAGDEIPREFIPMMYRFYQSTNQQHGPWGCEYLNRNFFEGLYEHYRHRLLFIGAFPDGDSSRALGMAMLIFKGEKLYGRYWGCASHVKNLHFSVCYYHPIEWAIENSIRVFDPGLGGEHKLRRGFHLSGTYSLHRFYNPRMELLMRTHMDRINHLEREYIDSSNAVLPFADRTAEK